MAPVASEFLTHSAIWDEVVDNSNEKQRVFAHSLTYQASTGDGRKVGDLSGERVDLYLGMRGLPGAGSIWATNMVTHLANGYTGSGASVAEFDLDNSAQHRGDGFGQVPYTAQNASAVSVNTFYTYRNSQGVFIDGKLKDGSPAWTREYVVYKGAVDASWGCAFCHYGDSYATLQSYGEHTLGLDFTNAKPTQGALGTGLGPGSGVTFFEAGVPVGRLYGTATAVVVENRPLKEVSYVLASLPIGSSAPPAGSS